MDSYRWREFTRPSPEKRQQRLRAVTTASKIAPSIPALFEDG
jgi:hypothetical protein